MTPVDDHTLHPDGVKPLGLSARLRAYFFAGVLVAAPITVTVYAAYVMVTFIDERVAGLIPDAYNPNSYLPFSIPGIGVAVLITALTLIGFLTAGFVGRLVLRIGEGLVERVPVINTVYGAVKQIFEAVLNSQSTAFRQVCLVEYPRQGIWSIGFVSGTTQGQVQNLIPQETINVFLPTTPNPTSGYLLFVPRADVYILDMTVEEGIKMVMSGGIVTPPDPQEKQALEQADGSA